LRLPSLPYAFWQCAHSKSLFICRAGRRRRLPFASLLQFAAPPEF
jgi:hypothetical protein